MFGYTFQWRQAFRALPQMLEGAVITLQVAGAVHADRRGKRSRCC
jgi:hypothetical protein